MKKRILRVAGTGAILAAAVLLWAQWTPSVHSILPPSVVNDADLNIIRTINSAERQPILLVIDLSDPNIYARYVTEILRAEGISSFETVDLSSILVDTAVLNRYPLVIADASSRRMSDRYVTFERYVENGGRLLLVAPPPEFDSLTGLRRTGEVAVDGRLLLDSTSEFLSGFPQASLQIFGSIALAVPDRASVLANLRSARQPEKYAAITVVRSGRGMVGCITYELGRSIVVTRQGRPPSGSVVESIDRDGDGVFKASDLFYETYDYANRFIPQADLQQRLFVKLIHHLLESKLRLPQIWYFPDAQPAVALLTGDHHGWLSQSAMPGIANLMDSVKGRFSFFVYPDQIDSALVSRLMANGHTVEPHLYYPTKSNRLLRLRLMLARLLSSTSFFRPRFGDLASEIDRGGDEFSRLHAGVPDATRFHYLIWWGWTETAELLAAKGYGMDLSISGIDPHCAERPGVVDRWNSPMGYGYVNGSGLPMRPMTRSGGLPPIFLQLTQFEDDVVARELVSSPPNDEGTTERLVDLTRRFIDASIDSFHTALVWNFHPEHTIQRWPPEAPTTGKWIRSTVEYLRQRGVPMMSVREWLGFNRSRRTIRVTHVEDNPVSHTGSFSVVSGDDVQKVTLLIPSPDNAITMIGIGEGKGCAFQPVVRVQRHGESLITLTIDLKGSVPVELKYK
jgi:hypothetical protein